MQRRKAVRFRLLTIALAASALLLVAELGLRIAGYEPLASGKTRKSAILFRESDDPELIYEPTPGAVGYGQRDYVRINSAGFRDDEYELEKPPGTERIVVLGDSISFAIGLRSEERFSELLEADLAQGEAAVEVLNLGVSGYDTLQEIAFLRRVGLAYDPDLVVVTFCVNDLGIHSIAGSYIRRAQGYDGLLYRLRVVQFLAQQRDRLSQSREFDEANRTQTFGEKFVGRIARLDGDDELRDLRERLRAGLEDRGGGPRRGFLRWYDSDERVGRLRYAFAELDALSREHGFDVAVLVVPYLAEREYADIYDVVYEIVGHEARRFDFAVLTLAAEFRAVGMERVGATDSPLHPNREGHRILADRLLAYLNDRGKKGVSSRKPDAGLDHGDTSP